MSQPGVLGEVAVVVDEVLLHQARLYVLVLDVPDQQTAIPGVALEIEVMTRRNNYIAGNIYLGTLNTVEPVEKFIRPERIVVSFEVWQCESEYNWAGAGRHQILIIDLHLNSTGGTAELALIS